MIGLLIPELLLLALPAAALWWLTRPPERMGAAVRALLLAAVVLALAGPIVQRPATGRDVVVVVDRSASMPAASQTRAEEIIGLLEGSRGPGDRVAVVRVGEQAVIERPLSEEGRFEGFTAGEGEQGSDIGASLDLALSLIPESRAGSIVLLSDGRATEGSPLPAARRAASRQVPIHVRHLGRPLAREDLSVARLDLPPALDVDEPFQFSGWVRADTQQEADWVLTRDGSVLSSGRQVFEPGLNRLVFRDALPQAGVGVYQLQVSAGQGDPQPQNNVGTGAVLAEGRRSILVLNDSGAASTLSQALEQGGLEVHVATPEDHPLSALSLSRYRAVVLENVDAQRLGLEGMSALRSFVELQGGGLLMTGGHASFGVGGYHHSTLEPVLPVSMELKQEHRKVGMALSVVLDRSGSMAAEVQPGLTKMDLANDGTATAIRMLSPIDSVSVIAVDSAPHVIVPQAPVEDPDAMAADVARIESMGGGIYTRVALEAAHEQLLKAPQRNKHVILFSDAADSEQQEGVPGLLKTMEADGVTVSVIALGTKQDIDAAFLLRTAKQGGGEAWFTQSPADLPRLFALDTLVAARSAWVESPTAAEPLPSLLTLGLPTQSFPTLPAYNLVWPKPGATTGVQTLDENAAVVVAWQQAGLGRTAAYTGQVGGQQGRPVVAWGGFSRFFVTLTRWTALQDPPQDWYAEILGEGRHGVMRVEVAESRAELPGTLPAAMLLPDGQTQSVRLQRVGPTRYEARVALPAQGVALASVQVDGDMALTLPPLALPHSPEFAHLEDPESGRDTMDALARVSGGGPLGQVDALWEASDSGRAGVVVTKPLIAAALVLLLLEIAGRRLLLWGRISRRPSARGGRGGRAEGTSLMGRGPAKRASKAAPERLAKVSEGQPAAPPPADDSDDDGPQDGMGSALDRARSKAGRKLKR
ncbi:MAG: VWA domain-containing protein [Myxococcota bacterium]|nr:VWA domain-containing protein [Myxococcota bacterium]